MASNSTKALFAIALLIACSSPPAVVPGTATAPVTLAEASAPENVDAYRDAGFMVGAGSIPYIGMVRYVATEFLDSTGVIVALSVPPRSLSFVRAGDRYAAFYAMRVDLMRGDAIVRSERPTGEVRVASFAETTRGDEGVIFQRTIRVAPGTYALRVTAQDSLGTGTGTSTTSIVVPALPDSSFSSVVPVFFAEPRRERNAALAIVTNPRATVRYGRDSVISLYVEGYGPDAPGFVGLTAVRTGAPGTVLLRDSIALSGGTKVRAGRVNLPVYMLGLGTSTVLAAVPGRMAEAQVVAVTLGVDMPVTSVAELIESLKYFATEAELQRLRGASDAARPALWAALVRRTDPNPATPDNEALLEYARRLRVAERQFRDGDRHGWQTDRGAVVSALGEPDYMTEPQPAEPVGDARVVTWAYRRHGLFLVFSDNGVRGQWRLTPLSENNFRALVALAGPCVGCR